MPLITVIINIENAYGHKPRSLEEQLKLWAIRNYRVEWGFCGSYVPGANRIAISHQLMILGRSFVFPILRWTNKVQEIFAWEVCPKGLMKNCLWKCYVMCTLLYKLLWWWHCWGPTLEYVLNWISSVKKMQKHKPIQKAFWHKWRCILLFVKYDFTFVGNHTVSSNQQCLKCVLMVCEWVLHKKAFPVVSIWKTLS